MRQLSQRFPGPVIGQAVGDNHLEPAFWLLLTKDRFDTILYVPGFV
jgi:hypothetical protein